MSRDSWCHADEPAPAFGRHVPPATMNCIAVITTLAARAQARALARALVERTLAACLITRVTGFGGIRRRLRRHAGAGRRARIASRR
jgi:hypothetical protein